MHSLQGQLRRGNDGGVCVRETRRSSVRRLRLNRARPITWRAQTGGPVDREPCRSHGQEASTRNRGCATPDGLDSVDNVTDKSSPSRPHLDEWLKGAPARHPLARADQTDPMLAITLNTLDTLLADVEAAKPRRLPSKRKEFRAVESEQALLDVRTELAMAAKLHRAGLKFDFGTPGQPSPDLHLRDRDFAIEVTSKTSNGVPQLYDEIEATLRDYPGSSVHLRFSDFPIRMQPGARAQLLERIVPVAAQASSTGVGGIVEVKFMDTKNPSEIIVAADVLPVPSLGGQGIRITLESTGGLLEPTMTAIEDEILAILDQPAKARQGRSKPSLLLVDFARLGNAWLRPLNIWAKRLASRLPDDCPFLAVAVTSADLHQVDLALAIALRPGLTDVERAGVERTLVELGLSEAN
jgi:hypothetical protein